MKRKNAANDYFVDLLPCMGIGVTNKPELWHGRGNPALNINLSCSGKISKSNIANLKSKNM